VNRGELILFGGFQLESFDSVVELANIFQQRVVLFIFPDWLGGSTKHDRVWWHVLSQSRHRADHDLIADFDMTAKANLAGERDIVAKPSAARDADLSAEDAMASDGHIVADLNQVVDFRAFLDPSASETGAIDGRIRTDLDVIIDLDDPSLGYFFMTPLADFVTESLGTNHDAVVKSHAVSNGATLAHGDVGIQTAVVAKGGFLADEATGFDDASGT